MKVHFFHMQQLNHIEHLGGRGAVRTSIVLITQMSTIYPPLLPFSSGHTLVMMLNIPQNSCGMIQASTEAFLQEKGWSECLTAKDRYGEVAPCGPGI